MAKAVFLRMPWEQEAAKVRRPCSRLSACSSCAVRARVSSRGHAVDIAGEQQVLFHGEVVEQSEVFRQYADAALQLQRVGRGIQAADA